MFTELNISPVKRACVYEYRVNSRVVGKQEVIRFLVESRCGAVV